MQRVASTGNVNSDGENLVASYHNRNLDYSKVMGIALPQSEQHTKGLYKA